MFDFIIFAKSKYIAGNYKKYLKCKFYVWFLFDILVKFID